MEHKQYDVVVIGGGIVGMATAMALTERHSISLAVVEAESAPAAHQTGHNSGVIHSGLYYKPGSLKAENCTSGREKMVAFCEEHDLPYDRCGKVVVATDESQLPALDELEKRGNANGLEGVRRLAGPEIEEFEPHVKGIAGLHVPQTGIVDYTKVTNKFAEIVSQNGGETIFNARVHGFIKHVDGLILETPKGAFRTKNIINCAGLQSDRIASMCGVKPGLQIVPFRGEYYELVPERQELVKNLIYPVPDPRFPFLGVHFTRMIGGGVEAGPNAVLAFKREGYKKSDISIPDMMKYGFYPGFWKMAAKYWKMGIDETVRSYSKRRFVEALQELVPDLTMDDVHPAGAGVRAQALDPDGTLADDFRIVNAEHMIHVLNAPSPAATASISIGETIADMAAKDFGLT